MGFRNAFKQIFKSQIYGGSFIRVLAFFVFFFIFLFIVSSDFIFIFLAVISFIMFFVFLYLHITNYQNKLNAGENNSFSLFKFVSIAIVFISITIIIFSQMTNFNGLYNAILPKGQGNYISKGIGAIFVIILLIFIIIISRKRKQVV